MIGAGESELICDFAETYQIYDYKSLPASRAAILAGGLREDSRIKMLMAGVRIRLTDQLIATLIDVVNTNMYALRGIAEMPNQIYEELMGIDEEKIQPQKNMVGTRTFETGDDFMIEMKRLRGEA